jgi:2'-5' RNA ligase
MLDRAKSFPRKSGNRPLVLAASAPSASLRQFHADLGAALGGAGLRTERRSFSPHLTLLWDRLQLKEAPVSPVSWMAREFVLLYSFRGESRHELLGRWPLGGM